MLEEIKKNFEIIQSNYSYEEFFDIKNKFKQNTKLFAEKLAFAVDYNELKDYIPQLKKLCENIELAYIFKRLNLLGKNGSFSFITLEGEQIRDFYITSEALEDEAKIFKPSKRLLIKLRLKLWWLRLLRKKVIFLDRWQWNFREVPEDNKIYCRRRLALMICNKDISIQRGS